jgi:serine/threonine protein kinase
MSPEMINQKPYDKSTDIWGFGIIIEEMLTRKEPWSELSYLYFKIFFFYFLKYKIIFYQKIFKVRLFQ